MKKLLVLSILLLGGVSLQAQDVKILREGKTFKKETVKEEKKSSSPILTGFKFEDSKGVKYDIFMGPSGACYILKTSQKTGNQYKQYLGEEISRQVCKELGVEYTSSNSKKKE